MQARSVTPEKMAGIFAKRIWQPQSPLWESSNSLSHHLKRLFVANWLMHTISGKKVHHSDRFISAPDLVVSGVYTES